MTLRKDDAFLDPEPWIKARIRVLGSQLEAGVVTVPEFAQEMADAIETWAAAVHGKLQALNTDVEARLEALRTTHLADLARLEAQTQEQARAMADLQGALDDMVDACACLHGRLQPLEAENARLRAALAGYGGIDDL
jgi:septal ring factor EnvC (AmiA/AmiB activator)